MVNKKEVCDWFKELSSANRLDLTCGLLNMCLPLERRFLASFLENLCRLDFTALRSEENKSNDRLDIQKLPVDLLKKSTRAQYNVMLSLLYSTNSLCSNIIYSLLVKCMHGLLPCIQSPQGLETDELRGIFEDVLLILTLAINHPAFVFTQRIEISSHLETVEQLYRKWGFDEHHYLDSETNIADPSSSNSGIDVASAQTQESSPLKPVHVKRIEFITNRSQKSAAEKKTQFEIKVTWESDKVETLCKTYQDFVQFHHELIKLFPNDSGAHKLDRLIPYLPQEKRHTAAELYDNMAVYVRKLDRLPGYILQCDYVTRFFQSSQDDPEPTCIASVTRAVVDTKRTEELHIDTQSAAALVTVASTVSNKVEPMEESVQKELNKASHCDLKSQSICKVHSSKSSVSIPHVAPTSSQYTTNKSDVSDSSSKCSSPGLSKSLTFYNSHLTRDFVAPETANHRAPNGVEGGVRPPRSPAHQPVVHSSNPVLNSRYVCSTHALNVMSPHTSPMASPGSSPYVSPPSSICSGPSSPGSSQQFSMYQWTKKLRLHKYNDELNKYSWDQFINLTDEELEKCGLTRGAIGRFRTGIDALKSEIQCDDNGVTCQMESSGKNSPISQIYDWNGRINATTNYRHANVSAVPNQVLFVNKHDSSSSCSDEFSSPAASPQLQQENGTHSPRVDLSDSSNGKGPERKIQKIHVPRSKRNSNDRPFTQRHVAAKDNGDVCRSNGYHNVHTSNDKYHKPTDTRHNSVLLRAPRMPHVFPSIFIPPRMLHPPLRSPRPILGARPELLPPGCVPVNPRNGFHLPQPMDAASISNASHNASLYSVPVSATSSTVPRPHSLEISNTWPPERESMAASSNVVLTDRPKTSTPGMLNVNSANSTSNDIGTNVYQNSSSSVTTTTVTYSMTKYQNTSTCSSPSLVGSSSSGNPSPSPLQLPIATTVVQGDMTCSECAPNPCGHVVQAPPQVHYTYSSQHQPVWHQPSSPHHVFSPPAFPPPPHMWNSNGFVQPQPYAAMQFNMPTHNGYHPELTYHTNVMQNLFTQNMAQFMSSGAQHTQTHSGYPSYYHGKRPILTCYNCGGPGHKAIDCVEPTMEALGNFSLNMKPKGAAVE